MGKEKRKVLIVDDVIRIGQLAAKLIHWDELGMECLGILNDSEAALASIKEYDPDVVITDVRMPKISGLEMIKLARQNGSRAEFIVISGYREFEYAKTALESGVENYILKPINEEEVNEALEKVAIKLKSRESIEELQHSADESKRIIKRNYLRNLIENRNSNTVSQYEGVEIKGQIFQCLVLTLDPVDIMNIEEKTAKIEREKVMMLMEEIISPKVREVMFSVYKDMHIYGLMSYDEEQKADAKDAVNTVLLSVQDMLSNFDSYVVTIGVGGKKTDLAAIKESLGEAYRAACNRLRYGTGRLIYFDMISSSTKEDMNGVFENRRESIKNAADSLNDEQLRFEAGRALSEIFCSKNADLTQCYELSVKIVEFVCSRLDPDEDSSAGCRSITEKIFYCGRFTQLKEFVLNSISDLLIQKKEALESRSARPVRQAREYMEEHYRDKITLEEVANSIALNPIYFSTLFKKETGMNFSTYLVSIRMEKAKELLRTTNMTILQVSEEVGYKDSRYFSQLFRKTVGIKPALYRKLHY